MPASDARLRFQYCVNIVVLCALAPLHLLAPATAAQQLWGSAGGLPLQMVGAWWTAVAALSVLGLRSPLKYRWVLPLP